MESSVTPRAREDEARARARRGARARGRVGTTASLKSVVGLAARAR